MINSILKSGGNVERTQVILLSSSEETACYISARWQGQNDGPNITVLSKGHLAAALSVTAQTLVVAGPNVEQREEVIHTLESRHVPTMCVLETGENLHKFLQKYSTLLVFLDTPEGLDALIRTGNHVLRRLLAESKVEQAEANLQNLTSHAQLGRYIIDIRHNFNNCLTAVLGNAELLLMENGNLPPHFKEQLDTILSMALRMHQMMQRFSSLETEMHFAERHSHVEMKADKSAYVSGS